MTRTNASRIAHKQRQSRQDEAGNSDMIKGPPPAVRFSESFRYTAAKSVTKGCAHGDRHVKKSQNTPALLNRIKVRKDCGRGGSVGGFTDSNEHSRQHQ